MIYGEIDPPTPASRCTICMVKNASVKVVFNSGKEVTFCDLHAFVNSDTIWNNAKAIYDRTDILPPFTR